MQYEALRAMFEAYSRNKYLSTGIIQWMLNNAWPEMIWHLYDYFLNPGAAYFATKKACEPIHIQYSYDDNSIWIINSLYDKKFNMNALAEIYDIHGRKIFSFSKEIKEITEDSSTSLFFIPKLTSLSQTYFLKLSLFNQTTKKILSSNFYWLSTKEDILEWNQTTFYRTPCSSFANMKELLNLLPINLSTTLLFSSNKTLTSKKKKFNKNLLL